MGIEHTETPIHWNYFLSIEGDVLNLSRYIEFAENNNSTYSIELARILLAASSEIDVVAKLLCEEIDPESTASNIMQYRGIIVGGLAQFDLPEIHEIQVKISRFGLSFNPWEQWNQENSSPFWWRAYNKVKHERNISFEKANLKNTLNSTAALFVLLLTYYRILTNKRIFPVNAQLFAPPKLFQDGVIFYGLTHG